MVPPPEQLTGRYSQPVTIDPLTEAREIQFGRNKASWQTTKQTWNLCVYTMFGVFAWSCNSLKGHLTLYKFQSCNVHGFCFKFSSPCQII